MKEIICITCPKGCRLKVDEETFSVTGNACPRGAVYGANELRNPVRVVTSTVVVEPAGAGIDRLQNPDCLPRTSDACPYEGSGKETPRTSDACPYEGAEKVLPRRLPVKTDRPIPKGKMFAVMAEINRLRVAPPVAVGDILIPNVADTDGNVVATKNLP